MRDKGKAMRIADGASARRTTTGGRRVGAVLAIAVMALAGTMVAHPAAAQQLRRVQVAVGGGMHAANRAFAYYASTKANHNGYNQIVYVLHDDGQTPEQFGQSSGWIKLAEDNGFVVVFPEAPNKTWSPFANDEDDYLHEVQQLTLSRLMADPAPGEAVPPRRGGGEGGGGEGGPPADVEGRGRPAMEGGVAAGAGRPQVRIGSWQPWQYFTGAGSGARVAQEYAMNHPGLVTAVATLNAVAYPAALSRGDEVSQGEFQNQLGFKTNLPQYRPLKKDVPVPAWLFTAGAVDASQAKLVDYWKHSDGVAAAPRTETAGGFQTAVYASAQNPAQQVRVTAAGAGAQYDPAMTAAVWQWFSHLARWTTSADGQIGTMLTPPEVRQQFEERHAKVGDRDYLYWVKTPPNYAKGKSLPLVIGLHGGGYPSWMYLSQIKMHEVGEKEGFITVYLNGQRNGWQFDKPDNEDSAAIAQVIDEMAANYGVDRSRVYLQGFSIGSGRTFTMGVAHPQLFAAVSPNSGLGDWDPEMLQRIDQLKAKGLHIPMIVVYGAQDRQSSTDGLIPAKGVLRNVIDIVKSYDGITTPDRTETYRSPNAAPYDVLIPGAKLTLTGPMKGYPKGRFQRYDYATPDGKPMFSFVWAVDMPHGQDFREAQMEWDFFKHWKRNPDGSVTYAPQ
jgi:poly(3-hydroxybutyrate) depolymerase